MTMDPRVFSEYLGKKTQGRELAERSPWILFMSVALSRTNGDGRAAIRQDYFERMTKAYTRCWQSE